MKGSCKICGREDRASIDGALLLGRPLRVIASEFGLSRSSLHRHTRHIAGTAERAVSRATAAYTRELHSCLRDARKQVLMILTSARLSGDGALALQAAAELREIAETTRKLLARATDRKRNSKPGDAEISSTLADRIWQAGKGTHDQSE